MTDKKTEIDKAKEAPIGAFILAAIMGGGMGWWASSELSRGEINSVRSALDAANASILDAELKDKTIAKKNANIAKLEGDVVSITTQLHECKANEEKLSMETERAWEEAKLWKERKGTSVEVPAEAWELFEKCAERWKDCDWERATERYTTYRSGVKLTEIYNKCEAELKVCDQLIDSVTNPRQW